MRLKPRNTTLSRRALLYRRFDDMQNAQSLAEKFGKPSQIAKYQINKYYYVLAFDYMHTGDTDETTSQPIYGLIAPLKTVSIKYYDDYVQLRADDLVVIDNHVYSVESVTVDKKHQPREYCIYSANLNGIL